MRLKTYLTEDRSKELKTQEAIDLLLSKHKQAFWYSFNNQKYIYRGVKTPIGDIIYTDPKKSTPRKSIHQVPNYYTLIMSNSPQWKQYPPREYSIICATTSRNAKNYGMVYYTFPEDAAKIGVVPAADLWSVSIKETGGFDRLAKSIDSLLKVALGPGDYDSKYSQFRKACKDFDTSWKTEKFHKNEDKKDFIREIERQLNWGATDLLEKYEKDGKNNLWKLLNNIIDPKNAKADGAPFRLIKIGDRLPDNNELWTDSPCILIHTIVYPELAELVKNQFDQKLYKI